MRGDDEVGEGEGVDEVVGKIIEAVSGREAIDLFVVGVRVEAFDLLADPMIRCHAESYIKRKWIIAGEYCVA